jgi:glycerol-3-phosphate acyltransferase PlsX
MVRIAVDGMGGDFAPQAIVQGAVMASRENIADVVVVGNEQAIRPYINDGDRIEVVHTPVWVDMDDPPSNALRRKKDSSINRAFELLKARDVDAVVTAGNSGAAMAFAIFTLGRLRSIDRPAIATLHPNKIDTISIMVDAGGTVDCKPNHLVQFAIMGDAFARSALGIASPKVGILSNGEEVKREMNLRVRRTRCCRKATCIT